VSSLTGYRSSAGRRGKGRARAPLDGLCVCPALVADVARLVAGLLSSFLPVDALRFFARRIVGAQFPPLGATLFDSLPLVCRGGERHRVGFALRRPQGAVPLRRVSAVRGVARGSRPSLARQRVPSRRVSAVPLRPVGPCFSLCRGNRAGEKRVPSLPAVELVPRPFPLRQESCGPSRKCGPFSARALRGCSASGHWPGRPLSCRSSWFPQDCIGVDRLRFASVKVGGTVKRPPPAALLASALGAAVWLARGSGRACLRRSSLWCSR